LSPIIEVTALVIAIAVIILAPAIVVVEITAITPAEIICLITTITALAQQRNLLSIALAITAMHTSLHLVELESKQRLEDN
jgi:hypothetical protein